MPLLPEFKIGVWNAWILMLLFPLQPLILMVIDKIVGTGQIMKKMGEMPAERREKNLNQAYMVILYLLILYSIFLPLKLGTPLFLAGTMIYLAGLILFFAAGSIAAMTPPGQPFTRGIYQYSLHPGYLSQSVMLAGVGLASASWLFLIFVLLLWFLMSAFVEGEEKSCLQVFGESYHDYLKRTPRWLGLPRSK